MPIINLLLFIDISRFLREFLQYFLLSIIIRHIIFFTIYWFPRIIFIFYYIM